MLNSSPFLSKKFTKNISPLWIIFLIWLLGAVIDRTWFALDHSVPSWDSADYLNGVLNYQKILENPQLFNEEWWQSLWLLSSKIPPLTYILTVPFLNIFGTSSDSATLVMLFFSGILLVSIYGLGAELFTVSVGLLAAGLCQLLPGIYRYRMEFLLDYPLTAIVTLSFYLLTRWKFIKNFNHGWLASILFGLSFGVALGIKQTALLFLLIPLIWIFATLIINKSWGKLAQLIIGLSSSLLIFYPWYRTNWLLIFTSGKRATIDSAIAEGDPALNTLDAWIYYFKILPYLLSWSLLIVPIVGILIYWIKKKKIDIITFFTKKNRKKIYKKQGLLNLESFNIRWLLIFLVGGYFLCSLNVNKDARYLLPLLPVLSLFLAIGLLSWVGKWQSYIPRITIGFAIILMLFNLFPLGGSWLTQTFSPRVEFFPYTGKIFPHEKVVETMINTAPFLTSNLGVLPSTAEINQHNFSFYGAKANYQVYARQVGVKDSEVNQDYRSLDWFLTKTEEQGLVPESQKNIVDLVEKGEEFQLIDTWNIPDKSKLNLYHRISPLVEVFPISQTENQVKLEAINLPIQSPPGKPLPITYNWTGNLEELQNGILILTWENDDKSLNKNNQWIHDHAIGMGRLYTKKSQTKTPVKIIEKTAMFPPENITEGEYILKAKYLNRKTGETYPIDTKNIKIKIDSTAQEIPAPELDLMTQFRQLAPNLSKGIKGLDPIFAQTARINQYDPIQDYLLQTDIVLSHRLKEEKNLDWAYTIALSRVLREDVKGAINAWKKVIEIDSKNPYNHAYLAFVYLYNWQGKKAEKPLQIALKISPNTPEFIALDGISALMQGNLFKAWKQLSKALPML